MRFLTIAFFLAFSLCVLPARAQPAQDRILAVQYYNNGEFDKAAILFEKLFDQNPSSDYYYRYYFNCLLNLREYKTLDKLVRKQIRKNPDNLTYLIDQGYLQFQEGKEKEGRQSFESVLDKLIPDKNMIVRVANTFSMYREYDYALQVYEKGQAMIRDYPFAIEKANLYKNLGRIPEMISSYLDYLEFEPTYIGRVKNWLQKELDDDKNLQELQRQLYQRLQTTRHDEVMTEMLIWVMVLRGDFQGAYRQVKALDKRYGMRGQRVYRFANAMIQEHQYDLAIEAFEYIQRKQQNADLLFSAREGELRARKQKITDTYDFTREDLLALETAYLEFMDQYAAWGQRTRETKRDLAQLEAVYLHNLPKAISLVEELINTPGLDQQFVASCKLELGDYWLMSGDVWEATLLYSQVDKQMKDDPLGELARYKNARLSYYRGDFEWAQAQLDVLKAATSELIANDALELSVFITDNLGLDTTEIPMRMFARAELMEFQNRDREAMALLDTIMEYYPGHVLTEDIQFMKARIMLKQHRPEEAVQFLEKVLETGKTLLEDDALFLLGDLYEHQLDNPGKAMSYYEKIILEHTDSVYVVEARKRYRQLRGDYSEDSATP